MTGTGSVDVLLCPRTVLVVDVFRSLGDFEASYDVSVIDALEHRLTRASDATTARAVVSDALLFGFALRNQRSDVGWPHPEWSMNAIGARRASAHECATLALIAGCTAGDMPLAERAARSLAVKLNATIQTLARDMGERLENAGMPVAALDWAPILDQAGPAATRPAPRPATSAYS